MESINLTYAELAERRRCRLDTARALVRRSGWPKITGNDGTVRIAVPVAFLDPPVQAVQRPARPPDERQQDPAVLDLQERLLGSETARAAAEATVVELRAALEHERAVTAEQRAELRDLRRPWWHRWWSPGESPGD